MTQSIERGEPLYSCIVPVEELTGQHEEELTAFGRSETEARDQAAQLLQNSYGCSEKQINQLMQQAVIAPLSLWCGAGRHQADEEPDEEPDAAVE